jgi:predicted ester cyclase
VTVDALVVEDDRVAWRWVLRGVHTGAFLDVPPTGKAVVLPGANFQRVRHGRVVEHWTLADLASLARQLRG